MHRTHLGCASSDNSDTGITKSLWENDLMFCVQNNTTHGPLAEKHCCTIIQDKQAL
jgi:hypothetical protein